LSFFRYTFIDISHFLSVAYQQTSFTDILLVYIPFCVFRINLLLTVSSAMAVTAPSYKFFQCEVNNACMLHNFYLHIRFLKCHLWWWLVSPNIIICSKVQNIY